MNQGIGSFFITIVTSPLLYCGLVGGVVAMYVVWRLCRQSYLLPEKQFTLLWLGWLAGYAAAVVVGWIWQMIGQGGWLTLEQWLWGLLPLNGRELWQSSGLILAAYVAAGAAVVAYIRSIRYPLWKMLDMWAVGLMVWQLFIVIGWVAQWSSWPSIEDWLMLGWTIVWLVVVSWLYGYGARRDKDGLVLGVQIMGVFGFLIAAQLGQLSWQGQVNIVELSIAIVGCLAGAGLLAYRIWQPSTAIRLQDTPKGVSQSFKETFARLSLAKTESVNQSSNQSSSLTSEIASPVESTTLKPAGTGGVAVLNQEAFAPPVKKPVKKLLKKKGRPKKEKSA